MFGGRSTESPFWSPTTKYKPKLPTTAKYFRPPVQSAGVFQQIKILDRIYRVLLHLLPAYIVDGAARLLGHKPFLVRIIGKMHAGLNLIEYFGNRELYILI